MGAKLPERTCFYTYDVNGNEIHESRKEFTDYKKQKILLMRRDEQQ